MKLGPFPRLLDSLATPALSGVISILHFIIDT